MNTIEKYMIEEKRFQCSRDSGSDIALVQKHRLHGMILTALAHGLHQSDLLAALVAQSRTAFLASCETLVVVAAHDFDASVADDEALATTRRIASVAYDLACITDRLEAL